MMKHNSGFTLIEIMVAVAIFAVAGAALLKNASLTISQTLNLREKTLAFWVAENEISQLRSIPRNPNEFLRTGTDRHSVVMAERDWQVEIEVAATENENMRRVEIRVYRDEDLDRVVANLATFVGRY